MRCTCAVYGCLSTSYSSNNGKCRFHAFPKDEKRCQKWITACLRPDLSNKSYKTLRNQHICGLHFEKKMYAKMHLKVTAIPTINLPPSQRSTYTQTDSPKVFVLQDVTSRGVQDFEDVQCKATNAVDVNYLEISHEDHPIESTSKLTDHTPQKKFLVYKNEPPDVQTVRARPNLTLGKSEMLTQAEKQIQLKEFLKRKNPQKYDAIKKQNTERTSRKRKRIQIQSLEDRKKMRMRFTENKNKTKRMPNRNNKLMYKIKQENFHFKNKLASMTKEMDNLRQNINRIQQEKKELIKYIQLLQDENDEVFQENKLSETNEMPSDICDTFIGSLRDTSLKSQVLQCREKMLKRINNVQDDKYMAIKRTPDVNKEELANDSVNFNDIDIDVAIKRDFNTEELGTNNINLNNLVTLTYRRRSANNT